MQESHRTTVQLSGKAYAKCINTLKKEMPKLKVITVNTNTKMNEYIETIESVLLHTRGQLGKQANIIAYTTNPHLVM